MRSSASSLVESPRSRSNGDDVGAHPPRSGAMHRVDLAQSEEHRFRARWSRAPFYKCSVDAVQADPKSQALT
jgi:hypothetical protein